MRSGTVLLSELKRAKTWSVKHFLGDKDILDGKEVQAAKQQVKAAKTKLANAKKRQSEEHARVKQLVDSGKVTIITR